MKENSGKLKKIEASLIKRLLRISSYLLSVQFWSSLFILSFLYSWTLRVSMEHSWRSVAYLVFGARRQRKCRKAQEDIRINDQSWIYLQVSSCKYGFLDIFDMHGTWMWFPGYDLSLACRISWINDEFSQPFHFLDSHGVVSVTFVFRLVLMFLWLWVEVLVPRSLGWTSALEAL